MINPAFETLNELLRQVFPVAEAAGHAILPYFKAKHAVNAKEDGSPLTKADIEAHHTIIGGLTALETGLPIISEESRTKADVSAQKQFWLVDPLDGTKEFIAGSNEFTVNIALIHDSMPIMGIIHLPVEHITYVGICAVDHREAWRYEGHKKYPLACRTTPDNIIAIASKNHRDDQTNTYLEKQNVHKTISAGSSLKFCRLAEGLADLYPRFGPTMEWDTAAGHAILLAAGGKITLTDETTPLAYGKHEFKNPGFVAKAG